HTIAAARTPTAGDRRAAGTAVSIERHSPLRDSTARVPPRDESEVVEPFKAFCPTCGLSRDAYAGAAGSHDSSADWVLRCPARGTDEHRGSRIPVNETTRRPADGRDRFLVDADGVQRPAGAPDDITRPV